MILKAIDNFLNQITMYRITLYCLIAIWSAGFLLSVFGLLPYHPVEFVVFGLVIFSLCLGFNQLFAFLYKAPSNIESVYISSFIIMLLISPKNLMAKAALVFFACLFAVASKYVVAINKKHLFNPAAFGVAVTALVLHQYADWWIGTLYLAPVVFCAGFLIMRKTQREDLLLSFFAVSLVVILGHAALLGQNLFTIGKEVVVDSPWMFFAFVMLTEPATTPPTRTLRMIYGALVGVLFAPFVNVFGFYFSPELALLAGNIFSYAVSPKEKVVLTLKEKKEIAHNTVDFIFTPERRLHFTAGQYMEWTLTHPHRDTRGVRRYFTIASSPTEPNVRIGVKFYDKPSSYKHALHDMNIGQTIVAAQLAGDFTLPKDKSQKLVFLAGGIGVTPFRSMIEYLLLTGEKRDIVLLYANKNISEVAYTDLFDWAQQALGIRVIHVLENDAGIHDGFPHEHGLLTKEMIERLVPDYQDRLFYISGPRGMILVFKKALADIGVSVTHMKTDFFPGFA